MSMSRPLRSLLLACGAALAGLASLGSGDAATPETPNLGHMATSAEIAAMDLTVTADGGGLPAGSGLVSEGRATFAAKCAACHGDEGAGNLAEPLVGGRGTLASAPPIKSVASYWPYAPTLFDYIRRAMPLTEPQSLTNNEVYGLVAYLLELDGLVPANARLDAASLTRVSMPNRDGFRSLEDSYFDGNIDHSDARR